MWSASFRRAAVAAHSGVHVATKEVHAPLFVHAARVQQRFVAASALLQASGAPLAQPAVGVPSSSAHRTTATAKRATAGPAGVIPRSLPSPKLRRAVLPASERPPHHAGKFTNHLCRGRFVAAWAVFRVLFRSRSHRALSAVLLTWFLVRCREWHVSEPLAIVRGVRPRRLPSQSAA